MSKWNFGLLLLSLEAVQREGNLHLTTQNFHKTFLLKKKKKKNESKRTEYISVTSCVILNSHKHIVRNLCMS